jgi:hypothetical protein
MRVRILLGLPSLKGIMYKIASITALTLLGLFLSGCDSQPSQSYNYVKTQSGAEPSTAPIEAVNYNGQNTVGRACLDSQSRVVEDRYCDQAWIEQQRQLAEQRHDDQMLRDLMLYHFMFGGTVNNGYYAGGLNYLPPGYGYMPYTRYRTTVIQYHPPVVHQTVVVNRYASPATSTYRPPVVRSTTTTTRTTSGLGQTTVRSTVTTRPVYAPSPSYTRSYTRSYTSSSGSRRR